MEVMVHDLLKIKKTAVDSLGDRSVIPDWALKSLYNCPYVVVRRQKVQGQRIPIGIRGKKRQERFASFIQMDDVSEVIKPNQLVRPEWWKASKHLAEIEITDKLLKIYNLFTQYQLNWGIGGSIGYELATKRETVGDTSDIDVIIYVDESLSRNMLGTVITDLEKSGVSIDGLIETNIGGISVREYIKGDIPFVIRTNEGVILASKVWS